MISLKMGEKYICKLDKETRIYLEEQLNETDESRERCLNEIKKWMNANPQLHVCPKDRAILAFLRGCKFDLERTKEKLTNYQNLRRDAPEWFTNRNPLLAEIQELVRLGVFVPLRQLHENQLVVIIRTAVHDPHRHDQNDVFKAGKMILDVACQEIEKAEIYGVVAIFDLDGVSFAHARQMTLGMIRKAVFAWHNYHCRPKNLEFINAPSFVNVILNLFKSFMSDKLKSRVHVHFDGPGTLHDVVPKEILPEEYGGSGENLEESIRYWHQKLLDYSDWFAEDEKYKAE